MRSSRELQGALNDPQKEIVENGYDAKELHRQRQDGTQEREEVDQDPHRSEEVPQGEIEHQKVG
jgi:hypothetical protein